jgi:hypothetical protein
MLYKFYRSGTAGLLLVLAGLPFTAVADLDIESWNALLGAAVTDG